MAVFMQFYKFFNFCKKANHLYVFLFRFMKLPMIWEKMKLCQDIEKLSTSGMTVKNL